MSLNLNAIANNAVVSINPNSTLEYIRYQGFDNSGAKVIPVFDTPIVYVCNAQPLSPIAVSKTYGINTSKTYYSFWLNEEIQPFSLTPQKGQDKIIFDSKEFIVVDYDDTYQTGWTKLTGVLQ